MAQSVLTESGELIIPGSYAEYKVQAGQGGLSTTGVVVLIGEADAGVDYSAETDLADVAFGPDQLAEVLAKYKSGRLVDAFAQTVAASNDPNITGAPTRIYTIKTNPSASASSMLLHEDSSDYAGLTDKSAGTLGNLISYKIEDSTSEAVPTKTFTWVPNVDTINTSYRVNGGAATSLNFSANQTPAQVASAIDAKSDLVATGGTSRGVIDAGLVTTGTIAVGGTSAAATFTLGGGATAWAVTPTVGDTLVIPAASALKGGSDQNVGAYIVTNATATVITAKKLSNAAKPGAVAGEAVTFTTLTAQDIASASDDLMCYAPITMSLSNTTPVDGIGKTLEWNQLTTGNDLLERSVFTSAAVAVTWLSKTGAAYVITSATERKAKLSISRQLDGISEEIIAGGEVVLLLGYTGTTASVVIDDTDFTVTVTGGSGASFSVKLSEFVTVADLASYIDSLTGFSASVATAALGSTLTTSLDRGTFTFGSTFGAETGRIKKDAYTFFTKLTNGSAVTQLGATPARVDAGLPKNVSSWTYLSGGTLGATTDTIVSNALVALEAVNCNFVVPLFSKDATTDIADGLTASTSTYTVAGINAAVKSHVLKMSTLKRRRNRQAFLSVSDTFSNALEAAGNIASYRCSMAFQNAKTVSSTGSLLTFQPWMTAATAAGMQAAAFSKGILNKLANVSGILAPQSDWNFDNDSDVEDALTGGLLPMRRSQTGGFRWISDQTTYSRDNNFVFNSIQAIYAADTIALTCAQRMEDRFVGESLADVTAAGVKTYLGGIMNDLLRLKLIAPSDDAPAGFKNVRVVISGGTIQVSFEVKLAGLVYFVPINFLVSQVTQTA